MVERLPGEIVVNTSKESDVTLYDVEVLNEINTSGIPPNDLKQRPR
jgi:hypothetical protein